MDKKRKNNLKIVPNRNASKVEKKSNFVKSKNLLVGMIAFFAVFSPSVWKENTETVFWGESRNWYKKKDFIDWWRLRRFYTDTGDTAC